MIISLDKFVKEEKEYWAELDAELTRLEQDGFRKMGLAELRRFHYLYERAIADLARLKTFTADAETRDYLESIVSRAYGEIHESRDRPQHRFKPVRWALQSVPRSFRAHSQAFLLALAITFAGASLGGGIIAVNPQKKADVLPLRQFPHLATSPSERVAKEEESGSVDHLANARSTFAATLMTHNTRLSIYAAALGMTGGIGTIALLFYNGALLGAVAVDYTLAGETAFLAGWLLPHGSLEIPAILIAGQAGLVIAHAIIGWGTRDSFRDRLRKIRRDVVNLLAAVAIMLVWAGFVESFLSQHHEPVIPYAVKITFGTVQLLLLFGFLLFAGKRPAAPA